MKKEEEADEQCGFTFHLWIAACAFMLGLLMSGCHRAQAGVVDLNEVSLEYKSFLGQGRDLLLYPELHHEGMAINLGIDVLKYGFWDSQIGSLTTDAQFRAVWLDTRLGARVGPVEAFFFHKSQHLLDRAHSFLPKFPVEDGVGLKIYLYRAKP